MRMTQIRRTGALALVLILGAAFSALAQDFYTAPNLEFKGGVLAHDVPDLWSGFKLEGGVDINGEVLFGRGIGFLGGNLRPALGASINTSGYTSKGYLDARWEYDTPYRIFFGLGIGAAVHNGVLDASEPDMKALGSRVLFHFPIEIGLRLDQRQSISVYFEHTSNAWLADHNEGLDNLGVRYGIRF